MDRSELGRSTLAAPYRSARDVLWNRPWLLLFPLALPALAPFVSQGLTRSFDGGLHLLRIGLLDRLLRSGELYPRWAPELLLGHGYPLFNFYAPAAYYVAESFVLLGIGPYHAFIATFVLWVLAAGLGMYALAFDVLNRRRLPALVAAVAYLYSPYLLTNVFIRGAVAEAGAQALLPWILLAARSLYRARRPQRDALALALLLALLAVTHTITLLTLPPFLLAYMLVHWWAAGRDRAALGWSVLALAAAMALSAFFWMPLAAERGFLADTAYDISRTVWLPASMWTWNNFLDAGLTYTHTFARPIRLGLVQTALAGLGFFLARRRDVEWLFYGVSALALALLMGSWALPLWLNVELLSIIQFGWRLLALLSLPLALFAGALVIPARSTPLRVALAALAIGLIVYSHLPRLEWMDVFAPETVDVSAPVFAQTELEKGAVDSGEGNSSIQEFRPRWADRTLTLDPATADPVPALGVTALRGGEYDLALRLRADEATALRFATFYYPGWEARVDGAPVRTYPSTNLGLLTVDVSVGDHVVDLAWTGSPLHWVASLVSFSALAALAAFAWRLRYRALTVALAAGCAFSLLAWISSPGTEPIEPPAQPLSASGIDLLGVRTAQPTPRDLFVYPYWYVRATPADEMRFVWSLTDTSGAVVAESDSAPHYNAYSAANWPPNTVVDDAARIRLPDSVPAGDYGLSLEVRSHEGEGGNLLAAARVAQIWVQRRDSPAEPVVAPLDARYGEVARLLGYRYLRPVRDPAAAAGAPLVVRAGDTVRLALFWQASAPVNNNYHGFVHLVDQAGHPLVQEDQLPGPLFQPSRLWDQRTPWPDVYQLRIPREAESGLYWPSVGLYDFATLDRLPVYSGDTPSPLDDYRLPPIKALGELPARPERPLDYTFAGLARLTGYDLEPGVSAISAGESLTVTLHYEAFATAGRDFIRFVQVYSPEAGVVAQDDSPPQRGHNPTWAWLPGEAVADSVALTIPPDAAPGRYTLYAGFYDPAQDNTRLDVLDSAGVPIPQQWAAVTAIEVVSNP